MNMTNPPGEKTGVIRRRQFLRYAGAAMAVTTVAAGAVSCQKAKSDGTYGYVDVGSGDTGVLNYALAITQIQAAFYGQVVTSPYGNMSATEQAYFNDMHLHELAHIAALKSALAGYAIASLPYDFSSVNFADRNAVLTAAQTFEDLSVAGYNGIAYQVKTSSSLLLLAKIVSVDARHAAAVRDLLSFNSFVDASVVTTGSTSLENSKTPSQVIPVLNKYLPTEQITINNLGS